MIGTILNAAGILVGGAIGLVTRRGMSAANESFLKVVLGAFTVFYGLRLTWVSLNGPFLMMLKQVIIAVLAMILGRLAGRLLRLQQASNRLGRTARDSIAAVKPGVTQSPSEGFKTCATLFCAAPLGILGAVQDGLSGYFYPLMIKGVMEGFAALGFVRLFGWGAMLAALPVLVLQGTITLACAQFLEPFLRAHGLVDSLQTVGGLLVFCVALVMLELKKIELADYLPSLLFAPVITWVWK